MSKRWARLDGNRVVITIIETIDLTDLQTRFPDYAATNPIEVAINVHDNDVVDVLGNLVAPPSPVRIVEMGDFLDRFTAAEFNSIMGNNTARNYVVRKMLARMNEGVNLDGNGTSIFLDSLITAGFITSQRKTEILS